MPGQWRALRRRLLTPNMSEATFATRGFRVGDPRSRDLLESIGHTFLTGFGYAAQATGAADAATRLDTVEKPLRGFAYEGAAMCFAILDAVTPGRVRRVGELLAGGGSRHVYMVHVGIGWAMARLPRPLWRRIHQADPLLGWLALDGYGFHQAYFRTDRYVRRQERDAVPGWPSHAAARVFDQGVGRALWFVEGADVGRVVATIEGFDRARRADLYAGTGLAATYAGGVGRTELQALRDKAGDHAPHLAQGSAFAAEARVHAGLDTAHTALATDVFCGMAPGAAAAVTDRARVDLPGADAAGAATPYETWKRRIATEFASIGRR
ncbi:DUF1702 family protein [Virgisporangium ochraceum]|uniref:Enediyne biosynthesis protein n=1 Tax=Virgisporangium ochraceum TaxID=65505 RepID=A0A8J3ZVK7_9ACTN|nr:DUF1702 family protein [Virgisporangium ochraceum]GIJ70769.1 enediyne biosynthesis protein [Virgisporangium ochraceum]